MRCFRCGNFASHKAEIRRDYHFKIKFVCSKCLKKAEKEDFKGWQVNLRPVRSWKSV